MPSSMIAEQGSQHGGSAAQALSQPTLSQQTLSQQSSSKTERETRLEKYMADKGDDLHHRLFSDSSSQTQTVVDKLGPHYPNLPNANAN